MQVGDRAPAGQRREQPVHRVLQDWRMVANFRRFPERLVDHRIEGNDATNEFATNRHRVVEFASHGRQCADNAGGDPRRQVSEPRGEPALGAAKIGAGENDTGADDADADLAGPGNGKPEGIVGIDAADRRRPGRRL